MKLSQKNEFLPEGPADEAVDVGSLEFNEILDEEVRTNLKHWDLNPRSEQMHRPGTEIQARRN